MSNSGAIDLAEFTQGPGLRSSEQRELLRLVRELEIHHAELDLQNEALRRAQEDLEEARWRYFELYELAPIGYVTLDPEGRVVVANLALSKLVGVDRRRLLGMELAECMSPTDRTQFEEFLAKAFRDAPKKVRLEVNLQRKDGRYSPATLEAGSSEPVDKTLRIAVLDVPSPKHWEEHVREPVEVAPSSKQRATELEQALTRFQRTTEHMDDGICVAEADTGKAHYLSPAFLTICGRSAAEASDEPWPHAAWIHEEDRERVTAAAAELGAGGSFSVEYRIVRPEGAIRTVRCRAFLIPEQDRVIGIVRDLTDELALKAQLRQAQRLEAIGTLASGVAHDFNNLLMGVGGCAQLALRRLDPEHEAYGYLRRAVDAILRGANLTRQILRFSDTRRTSDDPVELDVIVGGARDLIHSLVGEQIAVCVSTGAAGIEVGADPGDIEQVLLNLASNARDAMPEGGVLTFRTEPHQGGMVALSVRDTGVGMSEETKRRVFEPFFTTKDVGKGTGLGLSTVFTVVRRMGGSIAVESQPGEGTTFTLYLPVVIPDPSVRPHTEETTAFGQGETILIVDDDPLIRMTVETHVESLGYRALTAATVSDALKVCAENVRPVDVVLTDIMMPGLLGSDLSRILQKTSPDLAVIFMSAHPWQELARQGHLTESARLLTKPFDARDLGAALHQALKDKPPSRPPVPLRIFVVDDDLDVADSLGELLQSEGHEVQVASGSGDALEKIPEFLPDLVLCDLNLDDTMGGLDLVTRLRDDTRLSKTVFLAVTGMAPTDCKPAALTAGFQDVLAKPLDFQRLSRMLASRVRE